MLITITATAEQVELLRAALFEMRDKLRDRTCQIQAGNGYVSRAYRDAESCDALLNQISGKV